MTNTEDSKRRGPDGLRAMSRASPILLELAANSGGLSLADLGRKTGLSSPTVHRMIAALRRHQLTRETPDGRHAFGPGTLILARGFLGGLDFRVEALPVLSELRDVTDEACHLGTLANPHLVYVDKLDSTRSVGVASRIGSTAPAVSTAAGRAILAYSSPDVVETVLGSTLTQLGTSVDPSAFSAVLARTRDEGYSRDLGENEPWVTCLGAPVFDEAGTPVAAIGLSFPSERFDKTKLAEQGALVRCSADRISRALGHSVELPSETNRG